MEIQGVVQNGVIVLRESVVLPEGTVVNISLQPSPVIRASANPKRVELPLFPALGSERISLTNDQIAEILAEEDAAP